ncbi:protein-glutamate methylesterase/protein-glutamine glutaminase [Trichlorobacter ammonificans]|uniref:Protein-glutamate methylesterase/protein-glutamine glutaminase n=1 Tax=Trichlorobacter ammonificans TaxID=2916410 RepID=A0ABM9D7I2_9BACT|nr:chemotaxis response regulator protein-glutamate methylesterase [Trichlorobacter ammonificans]CAH2031180.1 Protein-glutamate methylesterase/protein-glutamine glutaminase 2 [Trichlorobacter ammonificans]
MKPFRVLVVDDSAYSRRTISRMLDNMPQIEVVGYAGDGEEGIRQVIALKPDLVTLDLEMPRMDGFTLLRILTTRFNLPVIVISASSEADKVFRALEMGALDFVAKPERSNTPALNSIELDLAQKVRNVLAARKRTLEQEPEEEPLPPPGRILRPRRRSLELVAIAASTGGPPALQSIFSGYDQSYPFGIVVAQHMPSGFTRAFADRLNRVSHFEVREAEDGDLVQPGLALVAPGGRNMVLQSVGIEVRARILPPDPEDRYLPSADRLFASCAHIYGKRMLAVVLTGMGNDGKEGVVAVKEKGGLVLAESEASAVVYGMPREAAATGCVDRIVPLPGISQSILDLGGF